MNRTGSRLFRSGQMYREQEHREEKKMLGAKPRMYPINI